MTRNAAGRFVISYPYHCSVEYTLANCPVSGTTSLDYAALFRSTQDGIVKDDGGVDPALSAALSQFLMK